MIEDQQSASAAATVASSILSADWLAAGMSPVDIRSMAQPELVTRTTTTPYDDVDVDDAFLAGFRDCRREVLRFLSTTVDDLRSAAAAVPVDVAGLERHLLDAEKDLEVVAARGVRPDLDGAAGRDGPTASVGDDSALGSSLVDVDDEDRLTTTTVSGEDGTPPQNVAAAADLLRLAQNNPNIGRLLDELFELMDEDDEDEFEMDDDVRTDEGVVVDNDVELSQLTDDLEQ